MQNSPEKRCLQAALMYAARGWLVFPVYEITASGVCACGKGKECDSPGKHPRVSHGLHNATTHPDRIHEWWRRWSNANVAIRTGRESGLVVLDVDPRHNGDESLAILEDHHEILPDTLKAQTGGGGRHFFFAHPDDRE
ncbi:MAG: bifunctional DNA primase/polymerase [Myxococcales bacterium]|nr:bifunctional DNA primase/polymerase [Myxococcales bacterium]